MHPIARSPMSPSDPSTDRIEESTASIDDRFASLCIEDGSVVVYDREDPDRWIQTTEAVALEEAR